MAGENIEHTAENRRADRIRLLWPWWLVLISWGVILYINIAGLHSPLDHDYLLSASHLPWWLAFFFFFLSWPLMVMAMMLPSTLPVMALSGLRPARFSQLAYILAYLATWQIFSVGAFVGDTLLHQLVKRWLWLALHPWYIAAALLLLAGAFQFSPLKKTCLARCSSNSTTGHAWRSGWRYGWSCVASCWMLMLLMFASGGSVLLIMAALTLVALLEKSTTDIVWIRPLIGTTLLLLGLLRLLAFW
ncbi:MAG: DUF2182 domain-containing protein [Ktedonobacteraceae bacterium]|nr:DUF2182 domain-containing protein [Ktedonobacteraceae bacterium]